MAYPRQPANLGELYNIESDREEKKNIAAAHPDLIFAMRNLYIDWFHDVSRGLHPLVPDVFGAEEVPQITLSPRDLNGPLAHLAPVNWKQVHNGGKDRARRMETVCRRRCGAQGGMS
jgi:hypothetical protein